MIPIDYQIEIKREFMKYNILKIVQNSTWGDKEMTIWNERHVPRGMESDPWYNLIGVPEEKKRKKMGRGGGGNKETKRIAEDFLEMRKNKYMKYYLE